MTTRWSGSVLFILLLLPALLAGPRDTQWKTVEDAVAAGLPKTAIERLETIIEQASADGSHAEAVKALARKIALEGQIQGNRAEEKITRLLTQLDSAPATMKPAMEALLAHWYWQYFQQNRWRFLQRTRTATPPGPDLQTWDLARILAEIDTHFTAALADEALLKATPISAYDDLLEPGSVPDPYRPTLFDFLVYEALQFYQTGEQAAAVAEDEVELTADGPIFEPAPDFLRWNIQQSTTSPKAKAVRLYQVLLTFHASDADRSAFYDADLARLQYGHNVAVGDEKDARYRAALERFIEATAGHEVSTRAIAALVEQLKREDEPALARDWARRALEVDPDSVGAAQCFNSISEIEAKSAEIRTEHVWNAPWPTVDVTYRNITKVYFRAVPVDFDAYLVRSRWSFGQFHDIALQHVMNTPPAHEWAADLPPTTDFKSRTEHLPAPSSLKPGFYAIVASHDPSFGTEDNQVSVVPVWVSTLALVTRSSGYGRRDGGFVLAADTGEPLVGATVRVLQRDNAGVYQRAATSVTDREGKFEFSARPGSPYLLRVSHGDQHLASGYENWGSHPESHTDDPERQVVFFMDRALYRPGQSIHYKGICVRADPKRGSYTAVARQRVVIAFRDSNGREVSQATHRTNEYGSFSGVLTAPRANVTGVMTLAVQDGARGFTHFRVEEYKRPKFQVELAPPLEAPKLGAAVVITGKATAYSGAAIGGAKVKWRAERRAQLPPWCWWWPASPPKAIAHGSATTAPDGTFTIEFPAQPDRSVPEKNEPVFVFTVHADVTDTTGETRSTERKLSAGYTALQATLSADEWQTVDKPVTFTVTTRSLDGEPQPASGTLKVHALKQPATIVRGSLGAEPFGGRWGRPEPEPDPALPDSWETGETVAEDEFSTGASGTVEVTTTLAPGIYRASVETRDRFGKTVTARRTVHMLAPGERHHSVKLAHVVASPRWSLEPGETFSVLWGTGYETGGAHVEFEQQGRLLKSSWTEADRTQELITLPVTEAMRGGVTLRITSVRKNRAYITERVVSVPWSNKELTVKWETFRSKLRPGEKETWTAVVTGPDASRAAAEMVATLYDSSLDQYQPHSWPARFHGFRQEYVRQSSVFHNMPRRFTAVSSWQSRRDREMNWRYRAFPAELIHYGADERIVLEAFTVAAPAAARSRTVLGLADGYPSGVAEEASMKEASYVRDLAQDGSSALAGGSPPEAAPNLDQVSARRNLNETAFFFPHLLNDKDGTVRIQFTLPEALTTWRFFGFAHDQELRGGLLTDTAVTAKELMVEPNPPRFVREGDAIEFTVKVTNQSDQPQTGNVRLTFAEAESQRSVDAALGNRATEQTFTVPANQSRSYSWRITVPDGLGFLSYKAVAATQQFSDGEEGFIPVLSRRILVTESLPLPIRGKTTRTFQFEKLLGSGASDSLRHQSLTVQMTSQPAWYAVMALPYLMEFPFECSEQVFNRLYANALAHHIANSDPKIRRVFEQWKNTPALDSPLEKNQDIKSVLLEETPWLRDANSESEARRNIGLLFDANHLDDELARSLRKLSDQQLGNGLWPWFAGGRPSEYISLYIVTGFARLRHLGVQIDQQPALNALGALDEWMAEHYRQIQRQPDPDSYVLSSIDALYLYARSFFLNDRPVDAGHREVIDFFLRQSRGYWLQAGSRQSQAHLALALQRFGDKQTPQTILRSLKERSVSNEELGMFWRDQERSWWWYHAPIETQALMIEAFAEITNDTQAVDNCRVWLLKQKQTQNWRTTKATADAIYALLLRGKNLLASDALVEVALAGETVRPAKVEAGTGFYEKKFGGAEIKPAMGRVTVKKKDDGVSWGSVHWQYLEDIANVTPHEDTPLKLKKTLWIKHTTEKGQTLKPVSGPLNVGDELVVRIELRTDRDMEYVHLKDQRGSGTEPVNVLSRYQYQDGLAYYESTRDTASHFFIDYLPKGVYVFEYSLRVQLKGAYQSGIAEIQCMYAPEFNSHSESVSLQIE
jgi:uncharacterized protein YfaS (alpha-2-macroglobulin family)